MVGNLLMRGMLTGLVAGIFAFGFAKVVGEPHVDRAIAFEEQQQHGKHQHDMPGMAAAVAGSAEAGEAADTDEPELFSREVQSGIGLFTGVIAYAAGLGGLFALVFAATWGRLGKLGPRALSGLLAAGGFFAVIVVPMLKYPANPPSIGSPDTISARTELYFAMLLISVAALSFAVMLARRLARTLGQWNSAIVAALAFILVIAIAQWLLPVVNEVPASFPADLLWQFRLASLGTHVVLWSILGLLFGAWTERRMQADAGQHRSGGRLKLS